MDTLYRDIQRTKLYEKFESVRNPVQALTTYQGIKKVCSLCSSGPLYWKDEIRDLYNLERFVKDMDFELDYVFSHLYHTYHNSPFLDSRITKFAFFATLCSLIAINVCLMYPFNMVINGMRIEDEDGDDEVVKLTCSKLSGFADAIKFRVGFLSKSGERITDFDEYFAPKIKEALNTCKKMGISVTCKRMRGYYEFMLECDSFDKYKKYVEDEIETDLYYQKYPEEREEFDFSDPLKGLDNIVKYQKRREDFHKSIRRGW